MGDSHHLHDCVIKQNAKYKDTAHWHPVKIDTDSHWEIIRFLGEKGQFRGDEYNRHDWLYPISTLFLIRDPNIAMHIKLVWGV